MRTLPTYGRCAARASVRCRDVHGHRTQIAYPNAIIQTLSYNSTGQLTKIAATNSGGTTLTSSSYSYTNPSNGQATQLRYSVTDASNNTTRYTYDPLNRLTQAVQRASLGQLPNGEPLGLPPSDALW